MKIVKIIGGLGNQMFQYAFSLALKNKGNQVKIDVSAFGDYTLHQGFELTNIFNIPEIEFASAKEINLLKDNSPYFSLRKNLAKLILSDPSKLIKNTHLVEYNYSKYEPDLTKRENTYFEGYWQSEKYFENIEAQIRETYKWQDIDEKNLNAADKMKNENSVAVHVRRYDRPKNLQELHMRIKLLFTWRVCSTKYYLSALEYLSKTIDNPKFYIFTDNLLWVKKNIPLKENFEVVAWNRNKDSHFDMFLMSQCKHNIISMSSFSWWGAWLNQNPNKVVVAPKKWALRFTSDVDLIPSSWIRI